jgi:hypothetical protein
MATMAVRIETAGNVPWIIGFADQWDGRNRRASQTRAAPPTNTVAGSKGDINQVDRWGTF